MIKIQSLSTAHPSLKLSQNESLQFILKNFKMKEQTKTLYERIFRNESIRERRFSLDAVEDVLEEDPDKINLRFEKEAVALSARALQTALERAGIQARELDFLARSEERRVGKECRWEWLKQ